MSKWLWLLFFLIVAVGIVFRTYEVTSIPSGINRDEGSIAYTAYSLLKTGQDEYGRSYPISFQSFGDWKLPLYLYTVVGWTALLGMNELSVRITSILAGIATIPLTFFLVKELFKNTRLAFIAMFLLAVAPWHIHLSRVESEANTAVFLTTLSIYLFIKAVKRPFLLVISAVLLALTYYTYAGNYVFTTVLIGVITVLFYKSIRLTKWTGIAIAAFSVLTLFIFSQTVLSANKTKLSGINIFGDPSVVHAKIEIPRTEHGMQSLFTKIVHNRIVYAGERVAQNYLNSFSPDFLFINGGTNKAHNIENFGNMYITESIFLLLGVMYLVTKRKTKEEKLILFWLLIAPLAASITKDAPHTNRMFAIFPALPIVTAFGIDQFLEFVKRFPYKKIIILFLGAVLMLNILMYIDRYFIHFPRNEVSHWGLGYKQLYETLQKDYPKKQVIISRPHYSPYIFFLFYSQYDPKKYIQEAKRYPITEDGFVHVKGYDRYEFREIDWSQDIKRSGVILVSDPSEVPDFIQTDQFKKSYVFMPNEKPMFIIVEVQ